MLYFIFLGNKLMYNYYEILKLFLTLKKQLKISYEHDFKNNF